MTPGAWIAVAAVVVALGVGWWRLGTDGRFRGTRAVRPQVDEGVPAPGRPLVEEAASPVTRPPGAELVDAVGGALGQRATLLQFSSAFCAPCRTTRRVLGEVAGMVEGVSHVEVDAEHHLDATRAFGILRTPTTVVLDGTGLEVTRATGAPSRAQVLHALGSV